MEYSGEVMSIADNLVDKKYKGKEHLFSMSPERQKKYYDKAIIIRNKRHSLGPVTITHKITGCNFCPYFVTKKHTVDYYCNKAKRRYREKWDEVGLWIPKWCPFRNNTGNKNG